MNVGLPGTGIGGLFYLVTAFLMPVIELVHLLRGRSSLKRWRMVASQFSLAAGVIGGLWLTAFVLRQLFPTASLAAAGASRASQRVSQMMGVTPTYVTVLTLAGVVLAVEALHLLQYFLRRRPVSAKR